jgi:hypothetical protein
MRLRLILLLNKGQSVFTVCQYQHFIFWYWTETAVPLNTRDSIWPSSRPGRDHTSGTHMAAAFHSHFHHSYLNLTCVESQECLVPLGTEVGQHSVQLLVPPSAVWSKTKKLCSFISATDSSKCSLLWLISDLCYINSWNYIRSESLPEITIKIMVFQDMMTAGTDVSEKPAAFIF